MHTLRNNIVSGTLTLPIMALVTLALWILPDPADWQLWAGLAVTGLSAYLIMELNNRNALLRIRSRLMSTTFLYLMLVCPALHRWDSGALAVPCLVLSYFMLFASYQKARGEGYVFHAFLFLSLASIKFPPMLVLAIASYFCMIFQLRNFTWRTFLAGLLGAMVPYWFYAAIAIWENQLDTAFLYLEPWLSLPQPDYSQLSLPQWITAGTMAFLAIMALVHFFHTAYNDKIRTRMLIYVITTMEFIIMAGLLLVPKYFDEQMRLFIANSSTLIAHHYALGKGRFFNAWFYLILMLLGALGIYNYLFSA